MISTMRKKLPDLGGKLLPFIFLLLFFHAETEAFGTELPINRDPGNHADKKADDFIRNPDTQKKNDDRFKHVSLFLCICGTGCGLILAHGYHSMIRKAKQERKHQDRSAQ